MQNLLVSDLPLDIKGVLDGSKAFVGPEHVVVDLTNQCNNNCIGCWTGSPLLRDRAPSSYWKSQEFPYELLKEIICELHRLGTKRIRFTGGGEPFMHPHLLNLLEHVKSLGMKCALTTNFTLADDAAVDRMLEISMDEIAVSLWAGDPATYSRVHPNKTERTFQRIERLLYRFGNQKADNTTVTIANVLFNMNARNAASMFDFARRVKADAIYYTLLDPIQGYTDCLLLDSGMANEILDMLIDIEKKAQCLSDGDKLELENIDQLKRRLSNTNSAGGHYDNNIIDTLPCYVGWMFCRLLPDGTVSPCCRGVNKPMGNLFRDSFEAIWNSHVYCEFRNNAKQLRKSHPYFHPIGCDTTCDNLMHNLDMHMRILEVYPELEGKLTSLK
jgi:MoaA/NifB/PqqE/SkfB family radical SAM enzyme